MMVDRGSAEKAASHLSAVILAGGKSTRFGEDKARMELAGRRVLNSMLDKLEKFPFQRWALVRAQGQGGELRDRVELLVDDREGLGPLGGILTALNRLPGDVFVAACDMPLVSEALVEWLLCQCDAAATAVIPFHHGGLEPLLGIYTKRLLPEMEEAARSGRFALHSLFVRVRPRLVRVPPCFSVQREFANVNTLEDHRRITAMARRGK